MVNWVSNLLLINFLSTDLSVKWLVVSALLLKACRDEGPYLVIEVRCDVKMLTMSDVCFLGEDQGDVWEPDAGRTPQYCQVPQVLAGHEGDSGSGNIFYPFWSFFHSVFLFCFCFYMHTFCKLTENVYHLRPTGYIHHRIHVIGQPQAISEENQEEP